MVVCLDPACWQLDLAVVVGFGAIIIATIIYLRQRIIDRDVHAYAREQKQIHDSQRANAFELIRLYVAQSNNILLNWREKVKEHIGNEEEKFGFIQKILKDDESLRRFSNSIRHQTTNISGIIGPDIVVGLGSIVKCVEAVGSPYREGQVITSVFQVTIPETVSQWENLAAITLSQLKPMIERIDRKDWLR